MGCFTRSSEHLFSHSFVRASLNMHDVWSRGGASGTPQTAQATQAGPSRYDGAQLSSFTTPNPTTLVFRLSPPRPASHVLLRPSFPTALTSPVPSARRRSLHLVACPPRASAPLMFALIRNDSRAYFGDEIPQAAPSSHPKP